MRQSRAASRSNKVIKLLPLRGLQGLFILVVVGLVALGLRRQSAALYDETSSVRTTSAIAVGDDLEIQVDDTEWRRTVLIVDDDVVADDAISSTVLATTNNEPTLRFMLQGLYDVGYETAPTVDCPDPLIPGEIVPGEINFWDTANCGPGDPPLATADLVIWNTGNSGPSDIPVASTTLSLAEVAALTTYLGAGGDLFLMSHNYIDEIDSAACADGVGGSDLETCIVGLDEPHDDFMQEKLGINDYDTIPRSAGPLAIKIPISFDGIAGDPIGDGITDLRNRSRAGYKETSLTELSVNAAGIPVVEDNDAATGGPLAPDNNIIVRTNDGTSRVVFATNYLENIANQADPNSFRTLFTRVFRYLSDAPTVTVTNARTSETEILTLSNNGLGILTGTISTSTAAGPAGDLVINGVLPGDRIITTYTDDSPVLGTLVSDTTIVTSTTPVRFTDAGGVTLTTIPVPGTFYVSVDDQDKNTTGGVDSFPVTLTSAVAPADTETVTVTETGAATGIFSSNPGDPQVTALADVGSGDGVLRAADGIPISISYDYLGPEITRTFSQTNWSGGTTDAVATLLMDPGSFDERDDQTNIDSDGPGYFVNDDGGVLTGDWLRNDFAPNPNPIVDAYFDPSVIKSDGSAAEAPTVLQDPTTGDFLMWYAGNATGSFTPLIHAAVSSSSTTPIGRDWKKLPSETTYAPVFPIGGAGSGYNCGATDPSVVYDPAAVGGPYVMYFTGLGSADCLALPISGHIFRAVGSTPTSFVVDAVAGVATPVLPAPIAGDFDLAQDMQPSVMIDGGIYHMWYEGEQVLFSGTTSVGHASSPTGLTGSWTKTTGLGPPGPYEKAVLWPGAATEVDAFAVGNPTVAFDPTTSTYVMYYEAAGTCAADPALSGGFARAESLTPGTTSWTRPLLPSIPAENVATCGAPGTYDNIVFRGPTVFMGGWESGVKDPMLIIDPSDGIDRLYYTGTGEQNGIGLAWNVSASPTGTLHTNPLDTDIPGFTTTEFGGFSLTRLGHVTTGLRGRTSDDVNDLLFDGTPPPPFGATANIVNGELLGDADGITNGQQFIQFQAEINQDLSGPILSGLAGLLSPIFSESIEGLSLDVYQRENLVQALAIPAEGVATDALVFITDAAFTGNPDETEVFYDFTTALNESKKIVVDVNGGEVLPGDQLDYRIDVTNTSSQALHQVTVTDEIPLGTNYVSGSIFGTGANDSGLPTLVWSLGTLDPGETEIIGFSVLVADDIGQGSEILNQAFINSVETGVIPTDNPVTTQPRDPTILPVGAGLLALLTVSALGAAGFVFTRDRRRARRALIMLGLLSGMLFVPILLPNNAHAQLSGNNIYLKVVDADQNTDSSVAETVAATIRAASGDTESITLTETGPDTGEFRLIFRAVLDNVPVPGNQLLEVLPNDVMTLEYLDEFNTSGVARTVSDTSTATVSQLYTIQMVAQNPQVLPGGGQTAEILASPRDVFGIPAPDGTIVSFVSNIGSVSPASNGTTNGTAQTTFSSPILVRPTMIDASTTAGGVTDSGTLALNTTATGTTTTTTTPSTAPQPNNVNVNAPSNNTTNNIPPGNNLPPTNQLPNNTPGMPPQQPTGPSISENVSGFFASEGWQDFVDLVNRIINPITALISAANLALSVSLASWYPFLLRIFLEPIQLLFGRRPKPWGVVYNSLTKQPIDLAIVRIFDSAGKLMRTRVTDRDGRYGFLVPAGVYSVSVTKAGLIFPSRLLGRVNYDENYGNLYYGDNINVPRAGYINHNIPVDPIEGRMPWQRVLRRHFRMATHNGVAFSGLIIGAAAYAVTRTNLSLVLLALHLVVFVVFRRLARGKRPRSWGKTHDVKTATILPHAVVRIFDTKYQRLLETQVSDNQGRFGFFVGKSSYRLDALKAGYKFPATKKRTPNDYLGGPIETQKAAVLAMDIPLEPTVPGAAPVTPPAPQGENIPSGPILGQPGTPGSHLIA